MDGLLDWSLDQIEKDILELEIVLQWKDQHYLDHFMECEWYKFLFGAIDVLGENLKITNKEVQHNKSR